MPSPRPLPSKLQLRWSRLALAAVVLGLTACINDQADPGDFFSLEASPALTDYARVSIRLDDTTGHVLATLYDDSLPSLSRLNRLPAGPYQGGVVRIVIEGWKGGKLVYREIRLYDGASQHVIALDVVQDPGQNPIDTVFIPNKPAGQAPMVVSIPGDTTVSIRDSVPLAAEVTDMDGDLAGYTWDCNGDGRPEDSAAIYGGRSKIRFGVRFSEAGTRACVLKVWDLGGRSVQAKVNIKTVQDPPWADAGKDTTVVVQTQVRLHAKGEDGYGPIVSREWRIGTGEFHAVTQMESSFQAPEGPGDLVCVLKVTDSDSLAGYDTMVVHVVYSPDDSLSDLRTNVGTLAPAFRKDVRNYVVTLAYADSVLMIFPRVSESHASAKVEAMDLGAFKADSGTVPVAVGDNFFTVEVTAQDGSKLQYAITARREGSP